MGLFDIFRRKAAEAAEEIESIDRQTYEIPAESLSGWLREQFRPELEKAYSDAAETARNIEKAFEAISASSAKLGEARLEGAGKEANAVNMIKGSFAKTASRLHAPAPMPPYPTHSHIADYHSKASEAISGLLTPKQAFVLNNYFSEESRNLAGHIKQAQSILESLEKISLSKLKHLEDAEMWMAGIIEGKRKLQAMEKEKAELEAEAEAIRQKLDASKKAMKRAESSAEMAAVKRLEKELEACEARKEEIADMIRQLPAKKMLRKMKYEAEKSRSMPSHELSVLREFIREPLCVLNNNRTAEILSGTIRKAMPAAQETEDVMNLLTKLEGEVPRLVAEYDSVETKAGSIRSEIAGSPIQKSLAGLREEGAGLESLIEIKSHRLQKLVERIAHSEKELADSKASLSAHILSNFGKNVVLV